MASKYVQQIPDPVSEVTYFDTHQQYNRLTQTYDEVKTKKTRKQRNIVLPWHVVKDQVRAVVERGEAWSMQPSGERLLKLYRNPMEKEVWDWKQKRKRVNYIDHMGRNRWRYEYEQVPKDLLASGADLIEWFKNGFRTEAFENMADRVPTAMQKRPVWSEEDGEIDINRLYAGRDDFYMDMAERPAKPGIRLQIEMAFASGVDQKTIEEYGGWVNSLIGSMEAYGIDMVIDLWIPLDGLFDGDGGGWGMGGGSNIVRTNVLVRVKQANEVCDFTDWSILFSPGGYRQVGFAAKCVAGDRIGKRVSDGYGTTIGGKTWGLEYDRDESIVRITVNQRAYAGEAIPFDALTKRAIELNLIPDPEVIHA